MALHVAPLLLRTLAQKLPKLARTLAKRKLRKRRRRDDEQEPRSRKRLLIGVALAVLPFLVGPTLLLSFIMSVVQSVGAAQGASTVNMLVAACGGRDLNAAARAGGAGGQPQAGALSPVEIARYAAAAGFTGEDLAIAVAVALAESGGRPDIDNAGLNRDGSVDYGLWQINSVHQASGFDPALAFDPAYNAAWARVVFLNAGSRWSPWVTYDTGAYLAHLDAGRQAASEVSPLTIPLPTEEPTEGAAQAQFMGCGGTGRLVTTGFPADIDRYQPYEKQVNCFPVAQPGVVDFSNLLLETYPVSENWGIVRDCWVEPGKPSEHKEGRAFDWGLNVSIPEQRAAAEDAISMLLATDEHGNRHALFRRFGLMYIIWNRQIFSSSYPDQGWRPYGCGGTPTDCHTDHVHFSFGWDGAMGRTSYWTAERQGQAGAAQVLP